MKQTSYSNMSWWNMIFCVLILIKKLKFDFLACKWPFYPCKWLAWKGMITQGLDLYRRNFEDPGWFFLQNERENFGVQQLPILRGTIIVFWFGRTSDILFYVYQVKTCDWIRIWIKWETTLPQVMIKGFNLCEKENS